MVDVLTDLLRNTFALIGLAYVVLVVAAVALACCFRGPGASR